MPGAVFLEGNKINLRTIEEEDIEFLTNINNPNIWKNLSSVVKPKNMEQQREFFENSISSDEEVHLAISKDEEMKGIISLIPTGDKGTVKLGLWIAEEFHGNGYGTDACRRIVTYAFNSLRYHKVLVRALESNTGSNRIWEKLGFQKEGELREQMFTDGKYEDVYTYGILEEEWRKEEE